MMKDSSQFESLVLAKLKNLASPLFKSEDYIEESFQAGALLYNPSLLIAYSASEEASVLSFVLAHHEVNDGVEIHLVVDQENSELYEQVLGFGLDITIWIAEGKELVKHPHITPYQRIRVPEKARKLGAVLEKFDCRLLEEHGILRAEVHGLEVARVVQVEDGLFEINVGVGEYDQSAHNTLNGTAGIERNLEEVIATVRKFRSKQGAPHPLNRVLRSRWLMSEAVSNPDILGLEQLDFLESLLPSHGALRNEPCSAIGRKDESVTLVLAATGMDLSLVPQAGGQIRRHKPDSLIFLLPERDQHPAIFRQAQHLLIEPTFTMIEEPWPQLV